jgi:uncharacterized phage-like protein YoqJ
MILAVTGHRPPKAGGYNVPNPVMMGIGNTIRSDFARLAPERVLTGMALGVDQWVAWVCMEMDIPFTAVIPCQNFSTRWPAHAQAEYQHLIDHAADRIFVSRDVYTPGCLMQRNKWLVNNCDTLYAVWNGVPDGGTYSTIRYAQRQGRRLEHASVPAAIWEEARVAEGRAEPAQRELIPRHSRQELLIRDHTSRQIAEAIRNNQMTIPGPRNNDLALTQMEEMSRRQQYELARRTQVTVDQDFLNLLNQYPPMQLEPQLPRESSRAEFEQREALNRIRVEDLSEQFRRAIGLEGNAPFVPLEDIRASGSPIRPPPTPKPNTINTENRTTPSRFVDIGEDD